MKKYEINKDGLQIIIKTNIYQLDNILNELLCQYFYVTDLKCEYSNNVVTIDFVEDKILYNDILNNEKILNITSSGSIVASSHNNKISIIFPILTSLSFVDLKRIVLDSFAKYYEFMNVFFIHAAAVVNKDTKKSAVFVGENGSGKTTNILHLLCDSRFEYMANDRVGLYYDNSKIHTLGFPSNIGIRASTIENSKELKEKLLCYFKKDDYKRNVMESSKHNCVNKLSFAINELKIALNRDSIDKSELGAIFFTKFDKNYVKNQLLELPKNEVYNMLSKYQISAVCKEQSYLNDVLTFNMDRYPNLIEYIQNYDSFVCEQNSDEIFSYVKKRC